MPGSASTSRIVNLCLDANDPSRLGKFWAAALGWELAESGSDVMLVPTDGTRFGIRFEPVRDEKVGRNNIHLDVTTTSTQDHTALVERLRMLGADDVDVGQRDNEGHVVLADPEGNEFCIIEPGNNFLAGCGRLGAINADGTRTTGVFWSEVLGWPLIWDQDEETAIRAPDGTGPIVQWSGPPLMPKFGKNRLHLDVAPMAPVDLHDEVERLTRLGARRVGVAERDAGRVVMADPDDNEFCVLRP